MPKGSLKCRRPIRAWKPERRRTRFLVHQMAEHRMQIISSLDELDLKLAECDAAQKISDTALREVFSTFRME